MAFDSAKTSGKCTDTPALRIPRYTTSESSGWLGYDLLGQKVLLSDDDVIGRNVVWEPVVDVPIRKNPVGGKLWAQPEGMKHEIAIHRSHRVENPDVDRRMKPIVNDVITWAEKPS